MLDSVEACLVNFYMIYNISTVTVFSQTHSMNLLAYLIKHNYLTITDAYFMMRAISVNNYVHGNVAYGIKVQQYFPFVTFVIMSKILKLLSHPVIPQLTKIFTFLNSKQQVIWQS